MEIRVLKVFCFMQHSDKIEEIILKIEEKFLSSQLV